jgi:hypothetical protein
MEIRIGCHPDAVNVNGTADLHGPALIDPVVPYLKGEGGLVGTYGAVREHRRHAMVVRMSMGNEIGIRLRVLCRGPGSVYGKSDKFSLIGPEPYGKMGLQGTFRVLLPEDHYP